MQNLVGSIALLLAIGLACIFIRRKSRQGRFVIDDCINLCVAIAVILAIVFY